MLLDRSRIRWRFFQPWVGRHDGLGNQVARTHQVQALPFIAVFSAHSVQVRAGALAAPLERAVVDVLARHRIVAITQGFRNQRPDHLRVAVVAALTHINIAAREPQRRIRHHALDRLRRGLLEEQRNDLHHAAYGHHKQDQDNHQQVVGFNFFV
ncbi:hypothetical protein D9M73_103890 [compost metagenome]